MNSCGDEGVSFQIPIIYRGTVLCLTDESDLCVKIQANHESCLLLLWGTTSVQLIIDM